jgi:hypothetical protein
MVKRTTDYANVGAKTEEDFQATLLNVASAIERVPSRVTKKALIKGYQGSD